MAIMGLWTISCISPNASNGPTLATGPLRANCQIYRRKKKAASQKQRRRRLPPSSIQPPIPLPSQPSQSSAHPRDHDSKSCLMTAPTYATMAARSALPWSHPPHGSVGQSWSFLLPLPSRFLSSLSSFLLIEPIEIGRVECPVLCLWMPHGFLRPRNLLFKGALIWFLRFSSSIL